MHTTETSLYLWSHHGEGLARACLTIRKDTGIVAVIRWRHDVFTQVIVQLQDAEQAHVIGNYTTNAHCKQQLEISLHDRIIACTVQDREYSRLSYCDNLISQNDKSELQQTSLL